MTIHATEQTDFFPLLNAQTQSAAPLFLILAPHHALKPFGIPFKNSLEITKECQIIAFAIIIIVLLFFDQQDNPRLSQFGYLNFCLSSSWTNVYN